MYVYNCECSVGKEDNRPFSLHYVILSGVCMIQGEVPESIPNINDDNEEIGFQSFGDEESIKATLLVCRESELL